MTKIGTLIVDLSCTTNQKLSLIVFLIKKMGVFKNKSSKRKDSEGLVKTRTYRSKGDRLGWVSLKEAKSVNLERALSSGEVVRRNSNFEPLLVP